MVYLRELKEKDAPFMLKWMHGGIAYVVNTHVVEYSLEGMAV